MFEELLQTIRERMPFLFGTMSATDISPKRDWGIALVIAVLVTIGFIIFGAYLFAQVSGESDQMFKESGGISTINRSLLDEVLELYREKERNLEALKESTPTLVDPSL